MKMFKLIAVATLAFVFIGCATTMYGSKEPTPPQMSTTPAYNVSFVGGKPHHLSGRDKGYKFYWMAEPQWTEITKVKRKLSKNVDVQELMERPYVWIRTTKNTPLVGLRKASGFMNILVATIPYGTECFMTKYSFSQSTYQDATREPASLTSDKNVLADFELHDGFHSEVKISCDDYDKIRSQGVKTK